MAIDSPVITEKLASNRDAITSPSRKWWTQDDDVIHQHLNPIVDKIISNQAYRSQENLKYARLYANLELKGLGPGTHTRMADSKTFSTSRVTFNVVKSCIDTATSKIGQSKCRPIFLTEEGNWELQQRAKLLTKYLDGAFDEMNYYKTKLQTFRDGGVWGTGPLKFFISDNKVKCERLIINELFVDDMEGLYADPACLYQRKFILRERLMEIFPEYEKVIDQAAVVNADVYNSATKVEMLQVYEAWHLPSGPGAKDGKHAITIDNSPLLIEGWKFDFFPFGFWRWMDRLTGWYGTGLAEELLGIQLEIDKILRNIQLAMHLCAVPRVFIENSSKVVGAHISNEIAGFVRFTGQPPIIAPPAQVMPAEVYQHLENLYRKAYEITGISQMSATSQKPAGLNSGVALREYSDIASERFKDTQERWDLSIMSDARIVIEMSRELYKNNKDLSIKAADKGLINEIKWADCDIDDSKMVMRMYPTSLLPTSPAGKLQTVQELLQAGFIDREDGLELLDFPDVKQYISSKTSNRNLVYKILAKITEDGEYFPPEPFMDLQAAKGYAQEYYLECKINNLDDGKLEMIRTFMQDCQDLMDEAQQAAQAQAQAMQPQGQPTGVPAPQPQAQLMSNVPPQM